MPDGFYRRHLPHFDAVNRDVFVTWNLKGALPEAAITRIREERFQITEYLNRLPKDEPGQPERESMLLDHARRLFRISEEFLDHAKEGPLHLADPDLARMVQETILAGANRWYSLFAFVVMPNHVHLLMRPSVALSRVTMAIKRQSSTLINARMGTVGRALWQDESFDHFPRDAAAFNRIIQYIERNPVVAGLCVRPKDWRFSSAAMRDQWKLGIAYGGESA